MKEKKWKKKENKKKIIQKKNTGKKKRNNQEVKAQSLLNQTKEKKSKNFNLKIICLDIQMEVKDHKNLIKIKNMEQI